MIYGQHWVRKSRWKSEKTYKVVEAEASETAVISLLVPTTVLRGLLSEEKNLSSGKAMM